MGVIWGWGWSVMIYMRRVWLVYIGMYIGMYIGGEKDSGIWFRIWDKGIWG